MSTALSLCCRATPMLSMKQLFREYSDIQSCDKVTITAQQWGTLVLAVGQHYREVMWQDLVYLRPCITVYSVFWTDVLPKVSGSYPALQDSWHCYKYSMNSHHIAIRILCLHIITDYIFLSLAIIIWCRDDVWLTSDHWGRVSSSIPR